MSEEKARKSSAPEPVRPSESAIAPGEPAPNPAGSAISQYLEIKKALEGSAPRWTLPVPDPRTDFGRVEAPPS